MILSGVNFFVSVPDKKILAPFGTDSIDKLPLPGSLFFNSIKTEVVESLKTTALNVVSMNLSFINVTWYSPVSIFKILSGVILFVLTPDR